MCTNQSVHALRNVYAELVPINTVGPGAYNATPVFLKPGLTLFDKCRRNTIFDKDNKLPGPDKYYVATHFDLLRKSKK